MKKQFFVATLVSMLLSGHAFADSTTIRIENGATDHLYANVRLECFSEPNHITALYTISDPNMELGAYTWEEQSIPNCEGHSVTVQAISEDYTQMTLCPTTAPVAFGANKNYLFKIGNNATCDLIEQDLNGQITH